MNKKDDKEPVERQMNSRNALVRSPGTHVLPVIVTVLVLTAAAFSRNSIWLDSIGLWQDAAAKSPAKARPHFNLGDLYANRNLYEEAIGEFKAAVRTNPGSPVAHYNLGNMYGKLGRYEEAERELRTAIQLKPK